MFGRPPYSIPPPTTAKRNDAELEDDPTYHASDVSGSENEDAAEENEEQEVARGSRWGKRHPEKWKKNVAKRKWSTDLASKVLFNRTKDDNGSTLNWLRIVTLKFESAIPPKFFFKYEFDDEYTVSRNFQKKGDLSTQSNFMFNRRQR
uniref:Uncharacterized protein n=1 Tax=Romanomermis culicivorax TaxID=13658 RepID=A0A915KVE5_ROMCU